jgi:choline dehydrogenase-like flavoprotein
VLTERAYDVVIVGSGAGGGTVAQGLAPLVSGGLRVLVLEKGPRIRDEQLSGRELEMAEALYEDGGGVLTAEGTMTLAFARALGGSTTVYTGTSMIAPERVISAWSVPGLTHADVRDRSRRYMEENNVHYLPPFELNDNNLMFVEGCRVAGLEARQFPVNVKGCLGSSLCNLGCANGAKQGTHRVQLPRAEKGGVEIATRAEVLRIEDRALRVRVSARPAGGLGQPPEWAPGDYLVRAGVVVLAAGAVGTPALLLRSSLPAPLPRLGEGFTCHPALILVAEHPRPVRVDVGHPKSFYVDRAEEERFVLETCAYFPFTTAKSLVGFGDVHARFMRAFPRLQMILALACDRAVEGNRVGVDREGRPVVRYRFTPEVVEAFAAANRAAARIFFGAGATAVHAPLADPPLVESAAAPRLGSLIAARHFRTGKVSVSAAHLMGGCAMGAGPSDSVTDSWGRVHGLPWLRVADASLFPDSLEINPYLTIMALADRVAEKLREEAPGLLAPHRKSA